MRVLVTRPAAEARQWVDVLVQHGHQPQALPLIAIAPATDTRASQRAWQEPGRYAAWMFVSGAAVTHFFRQRPADSGAAVALPPRFWAPGPGTAAALLRQGVDAARVDMPAADAAQWDSEALWAQVQASVHAGQRVLIVRGEDATEAQDGSAAAGDGPGRGTGREWLAQRLAEAGVAVDHAVAYRRAVPAWSAEQRDRAREAAADGSLWLFSSAQAVANLRTLMPAQEWSAARAMATHPRIAEAARGAGFGVVWQSRPAISAVVASIESIR